MKPFRGLGSQRVAHAVVTELLFSLVPAPDVLAQRVHGDRIEGEGSAAVVGFAVLIDGVPADHDPGVASADPRVLQIEVDPAKLGQFAAPQPGRADEQPQRGVRVRPYVPDEPAQFLR